MLEQSYQIRGPLTSRQDRKELLVLACTVDRVGWRQACRPTGSPTALLARELLGYLETFSSFLPGRLGRWLRGASFLTNLSRQLGWLRL
jgi:hypothetical protein